MCGIAGILSPTKRDAIVPLTRALLHRGPDGEGYYDDGVAALGQRRLSIIDLEGGKQPIGNETNTVQLICNGEIYNSPELRSELIRLGHRFKTRTDVEVILHLYEQFGEACVTRLRGMFAFAIWDSEKRLLLLARDHMGQKPMYFCEDGESFYFASEVKAFLAADLVQPAIDLDALWHYVSLRFLPDRHSLFKNIQKLPAGHSLTRRDGVTKLERYWQPEYRTKLSKTAADIEDELDHLLSETVRMHLLSDVRVGTFLSGGIDSSTVSAMMAGHSSDRVPSFSIGVAEQGFNELPYARMVSDKYSMEAHEEIVKADLIHLIPEMVYHMDEPSDPFGVGVYLVSRVASRHVKVALTGDGGDENFAGYDRFAGQRAAEIYGALPRWFRRRVVAGLIKHIPETFSYKSLAQKAAWLNEMSFHSAGERYAQSMSFLRFTAEAKAKLFTEESRRQLQDPDSTAKILAFFEADNAEHLVDRMLYTDNMTRMPDHLLAIVDRMSMAHSLETRPPLVDYKMVEYAAAIPANLKLKGFKLKYILKKVAARYLPRELIHRRKQGFGFPLGLWMRDELQTFLTRLFDESRFVQHGFFEKSYVDRLVHEHLSGRADHNFRLWILMNLEFWYRLYFENETPDSLREHTSRLSAV